MSRPRKRKGEPRDNQSPPEDGGTIRQAVIDTLKVDPKGDEALACVMASIVLNRPYSAPDEELAGKCFVAAMKHPDPAVASRFFQRMLRLKLNAESPHRNAFAYYAYSRFIDEAGREPSKPELRAYIEARRNEFKDAPGAEDPKGWTRLWKESGLSELATR